ncbi:dTDP-4-dehydrorhamnose reductase [Massilia agilis]|uniref:dTDP-4-dehydrorhamnose reductase n=1 Tax=Massilia agilis TaxID=1811226 RepID=A0ABT2DG53_9BURK|nr:dTDP-4-dehydrorhamnose reductase [Massilia agilis]
MNILLTGASGQVGYELRRSLQGLGNVVAPARSGLDLSDLAQLRSVVRELKPGLIVNAAAYTAVERAESEPALALWVNGEAPGVLAAEARALGAAIVHYSTDYVFDGRQQAPYREEDTPAPLNAYGRSKLAGEQAVAASGAAHLILRTSWVYGLRGHNFLCTMLERARQGHALRVVADQFSAPTWSRTLAELTAQLLVRAQAPGWWQAHSGIYHLSCGGQTSWHGFAQAIMAEAGIGCEVQAIGSAEYPSPVRRPGNSTLCCDKLRTLGLVIPPWHEALQLCMQDRAIVEYN